MFVRVGSDVIVRLDTVGGGLCSACGGTGTVNQWRTTCPSCEGRGEWPHQIHVEYGPGDDPNLREHFWVVTDELVLRH